MRRLHARLAGTSRSDRGVQSAAVAHRTNDHTVAAAAAAAAAALHLLTSLVKPKFHYADFPVTSATSPRQTGAVPFSPNSITPTSPKLPHGTSRVCRGRHGEVGIMEYGLQCAGQLHQRRPSGPDTRRVPESLLITALCHISRHCLESRES